MLDWKKKKKSNDIFAVEQKGNGKILYLTEEDTFVSFDCLMRVDISPRSQSKNTAQNYVPGC